MVPTLKFIGHDDDHMIEYGTREEFNTKLNTYLQ